VARRNPNLAVPKEEGSGASQFKKTEQRRKTREEMDPGLGAAR